jgi:VanZ family protein
VINLKQVKLVARAAGFLAVLVIATLSLVPGDMRPHTGMPKELEHVVAYMLTAGLLAFGYGKRHYPSVIVLFLSFYSAGLEIAQLEIPGRTGNFEDFFVSTIGALVGGTIAWLILRTFPRSE